MKLPNSTDEPPQSSGCRYLCFAALDAWTLWLVRKEYRFAGMEKSVKFTSN
jgi:hypothetical protein